MPLIEVTLWTVAALTALPLAYLGVELAAGIVGNKPVCQGTGDKMPRTVILIPAHDESAGIAGTLNTLRAAAHAEIEILVVADNCNDDTARQARATGAIVIERNDPTLRGKGHALAFGRAYLAKDPPEVVIVLDADCALNPGSDACLARRVVETGEPVQARNLVMSSPGAPALVQISNFAMLIKNLVRARGMQRLGGGVPLFGTGMAFPWIVYERAPLASSDMVEDMQLGLWLARSGLRARLEEGAQVTSGAAALEDSAGQRRRWEHGFLKTAARNAAPLLARGLATRSRYQAALGAHLLVPPLALLYLLSTSVLVALGLSGAMWDIPGPAVALGVVWAGASLLLLGAWAREGTEVLPARALFLIPFYALWKIPIYVGFFIVRQTSWNRTRRPNGG